MHTSHLTIPFCKHGHAFTRVEATICPYKQTTTQISMLVENFNDYCSLTSEAFCLQHVKDMTSLAAPDPQKKV